MSKTESRNAIIYINGVEVKNTLAGIGASAKKLNNEMQHLTRGTAEYDAKLKELQGHNKILSQSRMEARNLGTTWARVKDEIKAASGFLVGMLGAQMVLQGFKNMIQKAAELSDVMADVRRTTGMTKTEVEQLSKELSKINTRSSRKELLELAKEAGKLGYSSVKDVKKFVEEADQINVALGEDLGKDAIVSLGKLSNIFKVSMLQIGSALNEVGQASVATEGWQTDFMMRMAGVAQTANLTLPELLGYGAALENLGQTAEVSGTAMSQMFLKMIRDTEKFEKIAGFANGELSKLIGEQGADEGMKAFIIKLQEGSISTQDLAQKLDQLGLDGVRSAGVLLSLANNTELVAEQQQIANKAFIEGTSITEEFNRRQETFGATMDKLQKQIYGFVSDNFLINGFKTLMGWIADTRGESEKLTDEWQDLTQQTDKLEKELIPLITRYDELSGKGKLNKDEQAELKSIIKQIADQMPTAVTQWDAYGNAIAISTGKVKDAISENRRMASLLNADAIRESKNEIEDLQSKLGSLLVDLRGGAKGAAYTSGSGFSTSGAQKLSIDEQNALRQKIAETNAQIVNHYLNLRDVLGEDLTMLQQFDLQMAASAAGIQLNMGVATEAVQEFNTAIIGEGTTDQSSGFTGVVKQLEEIGEAGAPAVDVVKAMAINMEKLAAALPRVNDNDDGMPALKKSTQDMADLEQQRKQGFEELAQQELDKIAMLEYQIDLAVEQGVQIAQNAETFRDATHEFLNLMRQRIKAALAEAIAHYLKTLFGSLGWTGPVGIAAAAALGAVGAGLMSSAFDKLIPEFAEGGYVDVQGESGSNYRAKNRPDFYGGFANGPMVVGEAGNEYVINNNQMQMPGVAQFVEMLEGARTTGSFNGGGGAGGGISEAKLDALIGLTAKLVELQKQERLVIMPDQTTLQLKKRMILLDTLEKKARG